MTIVPSNDRMLALLAQSQIALVAVAQACKCCSFEEVCSADSSDFKLNLSLSNVAMIVGQQQSM